MSSKDIFSAFLEASAGASASLFATMVFYPLDLMKTRAQAELHIKHLDNNHLIKYKNKKKTMKFWIFLSIYKLFKYIKHHFIRKQVWIGIAPKMFQTLFSSFTYFSVYSFLKRIFNLHKGKPSIIMNLIIASISAMINTLITLPLDVITTQVQIKSKKKYNNNNKMIIKKIINKLYSKNGMKSFYKGIIPSLLLSSNPAIHYTLFDTLKRLVIYYKLKHDDNKNISYSSLHINTIDAFIVSIIAKFIATMITYPLIRAKVLMIAPIQHQHKNMNDNINNDINNDIEHFNILSNDDDDDMMDYDSDSSDSSISTISSSDDDDDDDDNDNDNNNNINKNNNNNNNKNIITILNNLYNEDGIESLYHGCSTQLLHTLLKNALLLTTKERISQITTMILLFLKEKTKQNQINK